MERCPKLPDASRQQVDLVHVWEWMFRGCLRSWRLAVGFLRVGMTGQLSVGGVWPRLYILRDSKRVLRAPGGWTTFSDDDLELEF